MQTLTKLEQAALRAIFAETPSLAPDLEQQLQKATVIERQNTGGGFFTTMTVPGDTPQVNGPKVLGGHTQARLDGLTYGLGFFLFLEHGRLHLLEGYALGSESTASVNFEHVNFTVSEMPLHA